MAALKNLYAVLGVSEKADGAELRRAYLALAVKYHPDRNPGDAEAEERFKDISQAYAILSDPASRVRYERGLARKASARSAASSSAAARGPRPSASGSSASSAASSTAAGSASSASSGSSASAAASSSAQASAGAAAEKKNERPRPHSSGAGASRPAAEEPEAESSASDLDEILSNFFKTAKGRETLRDLEGALGRAGIKFRTEDFSGWMKSRRPQAQAKFEAAAEKIKKSWLSRLTQWLPDKISLPALGTARYDINYELSLTPKAAAEGTAVEISYQRDDGAQRLAVKIPPDTRDGARLRLAGQGRLKPDGSRGHLILTVRVGRGGSVADLWS